jgi:hypothetical protein
MIRNPTKNMAVVTAVSADFMCFGQQLLGHREEERREVECEQAGHGEHCRVSEQGRVTRKMRPGPH